VSYQLEVNDEGKPHNCIITESSGSDVLDKATCDLVLQRAEFVPATDKKGRPIPFNYSDTLVWRSPGYGSVYTIRPGVTQIDFYTGAGGVIANCKVTGARSSDDTAFCTRYDRAGFGADGPQHISIRTEVVVTK